jgi:hypothetical protein
MTELKKLYQNGAPAWLTGWAENKALELDAVRVAAGSELTTKTLFIEGFYVLFRLSDEVRKVIVWGGVDLGHIMTLAPDGSVFVYDWEADALVPVGTYESGAGEEIHPAFNTTCHLGEKTGLTFGQTWVPSELIPDIVRVNECPDYEMEILRKGDLELWARVGPDAAAVAELPNRTVPFTWVDELNAPQGALAVFPGYPTGSVWNLMQGIDAWAFSPFTRNVFPYWSWQPAVVYQEPGNGFFVPGFYYGDTANRGGVLVDGGINELGAPFGFEAMDVTFCAILDNRKPNSKKPYGYCEMLTRVYPAPEGQPERRRHLAGFLSVLPPETRSNLTSFYLSILNQRYAGTFLDSWTSTFDIDLTDVFADVPDDEDLSVHLWNFYDRKDDEEAAIDDPTYVPRDYDSTAFVAAYQRHATLYKTPANPFLLYETRKYHSHSVSTDGSKVAIFESEDSDPGVISHVVVFDMYFGFFGTVPRDNFITVDRYYIMTTPDGERIQYRVVRAGQTSADEVIYDGSETIVDGAAVLQRDGKGLFLANSDVIAGAEATTACIIPRRAVFGRDEAAERPISQTPYSLLAVEKKTVDDTDTYKWRSHLGRVTYGWPVTSGYGWVKIWVPDGIHAQARQINDPCMLGGIAILRPAALPPGGTQYTVTITENGVDTNYTGTFAELKDLLPYVLYSLYSGEEDGFYEVGLCKWKMDPSDTLSTTPDTTAPLPIGTTFSVTITPGSVLYPAASSIPSYCRDARTGRTDADGNEIPDDATYIIPECLEVTAPVGLAVDGSEYVASGGVPPYSWSLTGGGELNVSEDGTRVTITEGGGCGTGRLTVTDVCGTFADREIKYSSGFWETDWTHDASGTINYTCQEPDASQGIPGNKCEYYTFCGFLSAYTTTAFGTRQIREDWAVILGGCNPCPDDEYPWSYGCAQCSGGCSLTPVTSNPFTSGLCGSIASAKYCVIERYSKNWVCL